MNKSSDLFVYVPEKIMSVLTTTSPKQQLRRFGLWYLKNMALCDEFRVSRAMSVSYKIFLLTLCRLKESQTAHGGEHQEVSQELKIVSPQCYLQPLCLFLGIYLGLKDGGIVCW